jgi:hypothetical protein
LSRPSSSAAIYELYGLAVESPFALPAPRVSSTVRPEVRLRAGGAERFFEGRACVAGSGSRQAWFECTRSADGGTYLRWRDLFECLISSDGRSIVYRADEAATRDSFNVYLLGHVLSFSLVALGLEPLHGTVVKVGGAGVAFLGNCGYGKSTLAAAFLARGYPIVTDDLVALRQEAGAWAVSPGIPRLKLFPSVARRLLDRHHGAAMNPGTAKLVLPLNRDEAVRRPVPLKALYVLAAPGRSSPQRGQVTIRTLSGGEAFMETVRAAFNLLVLEKARLANQFDLAARLVAGVPLRRLHYPRRLSMLPAVCDAVLADLSS